MSWKFSCEAKNEIPLPPEYTFPRAFNYLNHESNSFYILENERGYIQCGGDRRQCTVELRQENENGDFKHFVFFDPDGSNEEVYIKMSDGGVNRQKKHCFGFLKASKLFQCYFEATDWPADVQLEDITEQFK